jgi:hypothetical protein
VNGHPAISKDLRAVRTRPLRPRYNTFARYQMEHIEPILTFEGLRRIMLSALRVVLWCKSKIFPTQSPAGLLVHTQRFVFEAASATAVFGNRLTISAELVFVGGEAFDSHGPARELFQ